MKRAAEFRCPFAVQSGAGIFLSTLRSYTPSRELPRPKRRPPVNVWVGPSSRRPAATTLPVSSTVSSDGEVVIWYWPKAMNRPTWNVTPPRKVAKPVLPSSSALPREAAGRRRAHGVHDAAADAEVGLHGRLDGECHQDRGVLPDVVEGDRLGAARIGVRADLVGAQRLFHREQQAGALGDDERLTAEGRDGGGVLVRGTEDHGAALRADVPLEVAVPRLLGGEQSRAEASASAATGMLRVIMRITDCLR